MVCNGQANGMLYQLRGLTPIIANQALHCQHFPKPTLQSWLALLFATAEVIWSRLATVDEFVGESVNVAFGGPS